MGETRVGDRGEVWEVGPWRAGRGEMGGGHQRAVWEHFDFGDEGGGMGGGVGRGTRKQCGLTTGLIWLVTRVGGWGEAWGGGPWRAGNGKMGGGAPKSSVGATKGALVGGWGEAWGGGPWRAGKGGDGGGHPRAVQKVHSPFLVP